MDNFDFLTICQIMVLSKSYPIYIISHPAFKKAGG